jgi:glyceraldehyde 3-phosphate dehydrogenase
MAKINVGINGFGRIGRLMARSILTYHKDEINIVGINDLTDTRTLAHLFKHDSVHGLYEGSVRAEEDSIIIDGMDIGVSTEKNPADLQWKERGADIVVESTGLFRHRDDAAKHLEAGAKKVIISAPAKGGDVPTIVLGVNEELINDDIEIYSNASCTTNCLAPMVYVLDEAFGIQKAFLTTVHAYTATQQIVDGPHKDLRRARAAAQNIVPTTTGAAKAVGEVLPHLDGKLDGSAMRVPVADGSITDLTALVDSEVTDQQVIDAFKDAAADDLEGVLQYSEDELVSTDIVGNPYSCIFDSKMTKTDGKLVKIMAWYDNEYGYASRTADLIVKIA